MSDTSHNSRKSPVSSPYSTSARGVKASRKRQIAQAAPGLLVSTGLHLIVLFLLSLLILPAKEREELFSTLIVQNEQQTVVQPLDSTPLALEQLQQTDSAIGQLNPESVLVSDQPSVIDLDLSDAAPEMELPEPEDVGAGPLVPRGELAGRSQKAKSALIKSQGGNAASEQAVNNGLKWLARHQREDGSWSFQHGEDDPGSIDNPTGATGLALLAFLGGGHTHQSGDYQTQVSRALKYLGTQMKVTGAGGDLRVPGDGQGMYAQGICTIALCEAYALSRDRTLKHPAQLAVNFIVNAQDSKGGGWRYVPGQPGDTSVVGWQVMALKSAKIAKLNVPLRTMRRATNFLNSVQSEQGARYGYDAQGNGGAGTTSVGLLCRMYLGWTPKNLGLVKGVDYLGTVGPQPSNIYFDYYATQVLHHWGGDPWTRWNKLMRDYLVETQVTEGDAAGSWKPVAQGHDEVTGGRLYRTCMSIMTLEVYYRHLPLYQRDSIKTEL